MKYRIGYSCQKPSTDTLAVNPDDTPLRDGQGRLLFRPAGHGALIENLNEIDADLVFIKTVDNVAPDRLKSDTVIYKEMLAGLLLDLQRQAFGYLRRAGCRGTGVCGGDGVIRFRQAVPSAGRRRSLRWNRSGRSVCCANCWIVRSGCAVW